MGQKVHPYVLRIGIMRDWQSRWFAKPKNFVANIEEDYKIRKFIFGRFRAAAIGKIVIERLADRVKVRILSGRPGLIIGRHGADIERLREDLNHLIKKELSIDIEEVKNPTIDARLVAENVALQIEKRIAFRRAIKRAIEQSMSGGAKGIKICCSGRLGGAEMCRTETYRQGKIPLQTLRADIDFGFVEAVTTYGLIGVKVWVYKGMVLKEKKPVKVAAVEIPVVEQGIDQNTEAA